jgi:hypothetical protein
LREFKADINEGQTIPKDRFALSEIIKANEKALAKHHKFQQHEDVLEMERDGIDHPFTRDCDDDYQERGLHRSDFIDNKFT